MSNLIVRYIHNKTIDVFICSVITLDVFCQKYKVQRDDQVRNLSVLSYLATSFVFAKDKFIEKETRIKTKWRIFYANMAVNCCSPPR